ncbi:outer membrane lipoprotein LolB [Neisseria sp. HSC-16F19]|nr:lipoprotein insertase outer membrane protein LolB [Neisseria sp. HSC-16F19]MCP2041846.1 outer membrane lipoprotein LolB [Neisseria sp. HSC-16F19]
MLYRLGAHGACLAAALLLAACSHPGMSKRQTQWQAADDKAAAVGFHSQGRLAVKQEEKGSYANFEWQNGRHVQHIDVNTPLGNTVGVLCRDGEGVIAEGSDGRQYQAANAIELSQNLLGFALPLDHLHLWARGYWAPEDSYEILPDGRLRQFGWVIERRLAADERTPRLLVLDNRQLNIRLVFDQFEPVEEDGSSPQRCSIRKA